VQHISCAGTVELIRAAQREGLPVTGEATPHHLLLSCDDIPSDDANWKMAPPLGSRADVAAIRAGVAGSPDTVLVLNADEPVSAQLGFDAPNPVLWYGLEAPCGEAGAQPGAAELRTCMACGAELEYDYVNYAHLGGYRCPGCGFARPTPDVAVTSVLDLGPDGSRVLLRAAGEEKELYVNLPALYNIYNAAAAIGAFEAAGLPRADILSSLTKISSSFGRMETFDLGGNILQMILVKNPAGCNQAFSYVTSF
jgi:UDP-N-acetylmuramyl tripeptide synthase